MARIHRQVTVVRDGWHNAFTDLAFWQGQYWVGYRKGTAHVSMDGAAVVSVSVDRERFREVASVKLPGDSRDPKLIPLGDERMAMLAASWVEGVSAGILKQYITFSHNGHDWEAPTLILNRENHWLWRVRQHGDRFYGLCYRWEGKKRDRGRALDFVVSDDLLEWETLAQIGVDDDMLCEADVFFQPDGEAWVIARSQRNPSFSLFCRAEAPYTQWDTTDLGVMIHAPCMMEHDGAVYVAGRRDSVSEGDLTFPFLSKHSLGVWRVEAGRVEPVLRIPATGDCSYPGLIKDPQGRICLSYYSQHAYAMGVIPHRFARDTVEPHDSGRLLATDDIYFAELELP